MNKILSSLRLTLEALDQLDELKADMGLTRTGVIETLIKNAHRKLQADIARRRGQTENGEECGTR